MGNTNKRGYHGIKVILLLLSFARKVIVGALIEINKCNNPYKYMEICRVIVHSVQQYSTFMCLRPLM